jgi:hypothetical protein
MACGLRFEGLVFQRLLTPELMPDEIFRAGGGALG